MPPLVLEDESRPGDEVFHGRRHEHFRWTGERRDSSRPHRPTTGLARAGKVASSLLPERDSRGMRDDGERTYVLGHSEHELERLRIQALLIEPITRRFLLAGGVQPGMRVLDLGCGAGDVSFLAADLVGETGEVVGVDRAPAAVLAANERARAASLHNVSFLAGDPGDLTFEEPFDALVGRYVLMFQPDPAALLRSAAAHVRPGGVIAFHEIDWGGVESIAPVPTFDRCCRWCIETLHASGAQPNMIGVLHPTFVAAGLPAPSMHVERLLGGGAMRSNLLKWIADVLITLLPEMERLGVATAADVEPDTLLDRMTREAESIDSVIISHGQVGAWCRR